MSQLEPQSPSDPVSSLHHMSTTAGVATAEYVSINSFAVAAAVLGLTTSLAFVGTPFLAAGAAGIICGIIALRQIRRSNGTQGGRALAWGGMALSVAIAGGLVAQGWYQEAARRPDKQAINALIEKFGKLIVAGDYPAAYALMSPEFREDVPLSRFEWAWKAQMERAGEFLDMRGNNIFDWDESAAFTMIVVRLAKDPQNSIRIGVELTRQPDGGWALNQIPSVVQRPDPRQQPQLLPPVPEPRRQ